MGRSEMVVWKFKYLISFMFHPTFNCLMMSMSRIRLSFSLVNCWICSLFLMLISWVFKSTWQSLVRSIIQYPVPALCIYYYTVLPIPTFSILLYKSISSAISRVSQSSSDIWYRITTLPIVRPIWEENNVTRVSQF